MFGLYDTRSLEIGPEGGLIPFINARDTNNRLWVRFDDEDGARRIADGIRAQAETGIAHLNTETARLHGVVQETGGELMLDATEAGRGILKLSLAGLPAGQGAVLTDDTWLEGTGAIEEDVFTPFEVEATPAYEAGPGF